MWTYRRLAGAVVALALTGAFCSSAALAGTSGVISGKVTSATSGAPLAGVQVSAVAPTGTFRTTTNANGFYSITGVSSDTYSVTFSLNGYDPLSEQGINVFADQTATVDGQMRASTKTLGREVVHGVTGGAYQPKQTVDTYTVTQAQINTIQGNAMNISETNLITSLPGAAADSSGYPTIRGGRENEEGFAFEGIPYTDAFTNQFTNTLATPGLGLLSVQLTPGAGSAVFGNNGTGSLNLIAKRGSYPGYAQVQFANGGPDFFHGMNGEYGTGAPDGRWSAYVAFSGQNTGFRYGSDAATSAQLLTFNQTKTEVDRELLGNFTYRFGRDNGKEVQLFVDDANHEFIGSYGGNPFCFTSCDQEFQDFINGLGLGTLLTQSQFLQVTGLDPYQTSPSEFLAQANRPPFTYYQPNHAYKFQFNDNIDASTFLTAMYYRTNAVTTFDFPSWESFGGVIQQGGFQSGVSADVTKQLGDKNLLKIGGTYAFLQPVYDQPDQGYGLFSTIVGGGDPSGLGAFEYADFLSPNDPNCPLGPGGCGYLAQFFPNGTPRVPANEEASISTRQDMSLFIDDTFSPTSRLKINPGVRLDGANYRLPAPGVDPTTCTTLYLPSSFATPAPTAPAGTCPTMTFNVTNAETQPRIVQPRLSASYEMGNNNSVRVSYGRSVEFPPLGQVDLYVPPWYYKAFAKIPSFDALNGGGAALCGITGFQVPCVNYAEQLLWENQNTLEGVPLQPVKPELFDNYDFSYSHQFPRGFSAKLTPWYRRGYQATASVQTPRLGPGGVPLRNPDGSYQFNPPVVTNNGTNHATGVEFLVTREAPDGLSGQFTATYINEFSNVIPLSGSEDFFPSIPPASLQLGNLYRVGFISPFQTSLDLNYTTKSGWRFSPQFSYNVGYPNGTGIYTAAFINGVPYNIYNTNFSGSINTAPNGTTRYVDPEDPGSLFNPHIDATRGTPEGSWAGGILGHPSTLANLTVEYSHMTHATVGFTVFNVFNSLYAGPSLNPYYQPVATGLAGPLSGQNPLAGPYGYLGNANYGSIIRGQNAYINAPNGQGRTYYVYYQTKL
jgi:hypothetical protein